MWAIAVFEIKSSFRRLSTYVYSALFFTIAFLFFITEGVPFQAPIWVWGRRQGYDKLVLLAS